MVCNQCDDELVEQLRLALAGAENSIRAEKEAQERLKDDIKQLMKETAERQREACVKAAQDDVRDDVVRALRNTPLVTEDKK